MEQNQKFVVLRPQDIDYLLVLLMNRLIKLRQPLYELKEISKEELDEIENIKILENKLINL